VHHAEFAIVQLFALEEVGLSGGVFLRRGAPKVLQEAILAVEGGSVGEAVARLACKRRMGEAQVLVGQLPKEGQAAHAVGKHMEYLQVDAVFVITHPEEIAVVAIAANETAGEFLLLPHPGRRLVVFFKVMPEDTVAQTQVEAVEFGQHDIQRLLQKLRIHQLMQRDAHAVHIAHLFAGDHGKQMGGIIQFFPADLPVNFVMALDLRRCIIGQGEIFFSHGNLSLGQILSGGNEQQPFFKL